MIQQIKLPIQIDLKPNNGMQSPTIKIVRLFIRKRHERRVPDDVERGWNSLGDIFVLENVPRDTDEKFSSRREAHLVDEGEKATGGIVDVWESGVQGGEGEKGEGEDFGGGGRRGYEREEEEKEERFGGHEELLFYLSVFDRLIVSNIELIYIDNI